MSDHERRIKSLEARVPALAQVNRDLLAALGEIASTALGHHSGEPAVAWLHALHVEIPVLCESARRAALERMTGAAK